MPYPAINLDGYLTGPWTWQFMSNPPVNQPEAGYKRHVQSHPASVSNPMRPDGTRAMSAWRHYGGWWRSPSNGIGVQRYGPYSYTARGCVPVAPIVPGSLQVWNGGRDTARLRALASWAEREVEYGMALRQAGQTARMVGDLGKGLSRELMSEIGKRGATGVARHWKKLPEWYLQYLYGWRPLMDDISLITDKLVDTIKFTDFMKVKLVGKWKGTAVKTVSSMGGVWGSNFNVDTSFTLTQRNKTVMTYGFPIDRLPNLEPIGFFGGLWEGAPYSFVLDWLAPVGSWLNALDANALACYFLEGCSSEMVRASNPTSRHKNRGDLSWITEMSRYDTEFIIPPYNFTRTLESPWSFTSRIPFRADLNLNHAAQGLSLLTQALKRLY